MNKWTVYQWLVVVALIIGAVVFEMMDVQFAVQSGDTTGFFTSQLMIVFGILVLSGLMSLIFLFQTKKSETFLEHRVWKKMIGVLFVWFAISFVALLIAFETFDFILDQRWIFYLLLYYFIYLFQLLMITVIHRFSESGVPKDKQIERAFAVSALFIVAIAFLL